MAIAALQQLRIANEITSTTSEFSLYGRGMWQRSLNDGKDYLPHATSLRQE
jgi:hypothetical protein